MKKLVAVLAAAILAGGAIFAGDFYNGDIQLQAGVGFDTVKLGDVNKDIKGRIFDFGIESWHLFKPIDLLGVGFSVGLNGGLGTTEKWTYDLGFGSVTGTENGISGNFNFNIGPAVGLYLGNVVRFGINFGYNTGLSIDEPFVYTYQTNYSSSTGRISVLGTYTGINFGLQAKFLPESVVNPVIGWRLVKGSATTYDYSVSSFGNSDYRSGTAAYKYDFTQNVLYAALSFSW